MSNIVDVGSIFSQEVPKKNVVDVGDIFSNPTTGLSSMDYAIPSTGTEVDFEQLQQETNQAYEEQFPFDDMVQTPSMQQSVVATDNQITATPQQPSMAEMQYQNMTPEQQRVQDTFKRFDAMIDEQALESGQIEDFLLGGAIGEGVLKGMGKLGAKLWDMYKFGGLPDDMVRAIKTGDEATLKRLLQEGKVAEDLGVGDLIYKGKGGRIKPSDLTSNLIEQKRYADELAQTGERALPYAKEELGLTPDMEQLVQKVSAPLKAKADVLKKNMTDAYNQVKKGLGTEARFDSSLAKERVRDWLRAEGASQSEIASIIRTLEPQGKALTKEQKDLLKEVKKLERRINSYDKKLASGAGQKAGYISRAKQAAQRKLDLLKAKAEQPHPYMSEQDIFNISKQLNKGARTGNVFTTGNNDNKVRLIKGAREKFLQEIEPQLKIGGSSVLDRMKEADKVAKQYYSFKQDVPDIGMLIDNPSISLTSQIAENPARMADVIRRVDDPKAAQELTESMLSMALRGAANEPVGALGTLDYSKLASSLNRVLNDPKSKYVLEKNLDPNKFARLKALGSVSESIGGLSEKINQVPGLREYISQGEGITGKFGRSIEALYDMAGYLKNETLGKVPGLKWTSSRVKVTNDQIEKATKLINDILERGRKLNLPATEIAKLMTAQEEQALDDLTEWMNKQIDAGSGSNGAISQVKQHLKGE